MVSIIISFKALYFLKWADIMRHSGRHYSLWPETELMRLMTRIYSECFLVEPFKCITIEVDKLLRVGEVTM
jgi:hypothetical protein